MAQIELGSLSEEEHRRLIGSMLGLDESLHDELVRRTGGNPLFAVELLRSFVERGVLEPGQAGFRLKKEAAITSNDHDGD
ncbi:MAG: hypothetical protein ACNA8W_26580, partial [Bradymonadaceae bacterium]